MIKIAAIAIGGAVGAVFRYGTSLGVHSVFGRTFPYGTLFVNVAGCLAMGLLYVIAVERSAMTGEWRAAMQIGLLGAFTTFSTFSIETLMLWESGEWQKAVLNSLLSVIMCLLATWAGLSIGRQL